MFNLLPMYQLSKLHSYYLLLSLIIDIQRTYMIKIKLLMISKSHYTGDF